MMRLFEEAIDTIISTRRQQIAEDKADIPRDILTLLLEARDPDTSKGLSEVEIRAGTKLLNVSLKRTLWSRRRTDSIHRSRP
jgi:cytochrome P450